MDSSELERTLARVAKAASGARERIAALAKKAKEVRESMNKIVESIQGAGERAAKDDKGAREGKPQTEPAQVEVVFK